MDREKEGVILHAGSYLPVVWPHENFAKKLLTCTADVKIPAVFVKTASEFQGCNHAVGPIPNLWIDSSKTGAMEATTNDCRLRIAKSAAPIWGTRA